MTSLELGFNNDMSTSASQDGDLIWILTLKLWYLRDDNISEPAELTPCILQLFLNKKFNKKQVQNNSGICWHPRSPWLGKKASKLGLIPFRCFISGSLFMSMRKFYSLD